MKLEPNMYVRTKYGYIARLNKINKTDRYTEYEFDNKIGYDYDGFFHSIVEDCIDDIEIIKTSHNIIDLIEEKDLLEIEYFSLRYEKRVTRLFEVTYKEGRFINLDNAKCQFMLIDNDWTDNDKELEPIIKSIVTKEMYSSVEYRLGDDK